MINILNRFNTKQGSKLLIELPDRSQIEVAVFQYPGTEKNGTHICMPSQVGCPIGCKFCATTHSEIPYGRDLLKEEMNEVVEFIQTSCLPNMNVDVLSFSGHGEPLLNYNNVLNCIVDNKSTIKNAFLTTVGIQESINEIMNTEVIPGQFFFSLHGATDEQRHLIIPDLPFISNLSQIHTFAKYLLAKGQKVTFNYMLTAENTTEESAYALFDYLISIGTVAIRFTPIFSVGYPINAPEDQATKKFLEQFDRLSKNSTVSWRQSNPTGSEIGIACGQMRANVSRHKERNVHAEQT